MALQECRPECAASAGSIFRDVAFMSNREAPVHRWVPWIAGFSHKFVVEAIQRHLDSPSVVLDPFAGVGTALVEADRMGHQAIGFEINPYAAFVSRMKLSAHRMDLADLQVAAVDFAKFMESAQTHGASPSTKPPDGFRTHTPFYSPKVLRKVLLVQDYTSGLRGETSDVFRLAFASTMVQYSNYSYEPSLGRRTGAGRVDVDDFPVTDAILGKVSQIIQDAALCRRERVDGHADGHVFNTSFLDGGDSIQPRSVDLLVTSPPYLNNYHYNRNTRPHLYWLGFCSKPSELKPLESMNFGSYWQNARDMDTIQLDDAIRDPEILDTVGRLRLTNPDRGLYGGRGWANYAARYLNDCMRFARAARLYLRSGATALVVIGNSILQGIHVPTDMFLAKIAEECGFEVVDIHESRAARTGDSIVASRAGGSGARAKLYESVVELRRL